MDNRVKKYRLGKQLSQADLSKASSVPRSTIAEIEAGKRVPGVDVAIKLSRALGVPVPDLFIVPYY